MEGLTQVLRKELNAVKKDWDGKWSEGESHLEDDPNWDQLEPEQKHSLRLQLKLLESDAPFIDVKNTETILKTLEPASLSSLKDRVAAMPGRYASIMLEAARLTEPKAQLVFLPKKTLKTDEDVDAWLDEVNKSLKKQIKNGPVVIA